MNKWLERNIGIVSLTLMAVSVFAYLATIYSLEYWTYWRWPQGEHGGVLSYQLLGFITVYHVLGNTLNPVFLSLDITLYLFAAIAAISLIAFRTGMPYWARARKLIQLRIALVILCGVSYAWTMISVDSALKAAQPIGGVVLYTPFLWIHVIHVYQGFAESSLEWWIPDFTMWFLVPALIVTVLAIRRKNVGETSASDM